MRSAAVVGEMAAHDGVGVPARRSDVVHPGRGTVPAQGHDGGVDELGPPGPAVLVPAGAAPVDDRFHGADGT
jgi:hypothetical protein